MAMDPVHGGASAASASPSASTLAPATVQWIPMPGCSNSPRSPCSLKLVRLFDVFRGFVHTVLYGRLESGTRTKGTGGAQATMRGAAKATMSAALVCALALACPVARACTTVLATPGCESSRDVPRSAFDLAAEMPSLCMLC